MSLESDIAELIRSSGRTRAEGNLMAARIGMEGAQRRSDITSNLFSSLAQIAANVPQQMLQAKQMEGQQQLLNLKLADAKRQAQGRQVLADAIRRFTTFSDEAPTDITQIGTIVDPITGKEQPKSLQATSGVPRPDNQKIAAAVTAAGFPELGNSWLTMMSDNEEKLTKLAEARQSHQLKELQTIGDLAFTADTPEKFVAGLGAAALYGQIEPKRAMELSQAADTEEWKALRARYMQFSPKAQELNKPTKISEGETVKNLLTGEVYAQGKPKARTREELARIIVEGGPDAAKAREEYDLLTPDKGVQSVPVLLDGKAALVRFDPAGNGKYTDASGADVTARVKPMPPASVMFPKAPTDRLIKVEHKDPISGKTVIEWLPESSLRGREFEKGVGATMEGRLASAETVKRTGEDIIAMLRDPNVAKQVGPAMGRFNTLRDFIGNPPPELAELAGSLESYALSSMGVHGMRSIQGSRQILDMLDKKHTPESLIKTIEGLNKFSQHLMETQGRPTEKPSTPDRTTNPFRKRK